MITNGLVSIDGCQCSISNASWWVCLCCFNTMCAHMWIKPAERIWPTWTQLMRWTEHNHKFFSLNNRARFPVWVRCTQLKREIWSSDFWTQIKTSNCPGTAHNRLCCCCCTIAWNGFRTCGMWMVTWLALAGNLAGHPWSSRIAVICH